jgi:sulfonate transport system substrate-binding protein
VRRVTPPAALLLVAGLAGALLSACSTGRPAAAPGGPVDLASVTLHVGDQKAGSKALLAAAGKLTGTPYRIEWSSFTSGPPLLEAINAGSVDIGGVGNAPPVFAAAGQAGFHAVAASNASTKGSAIVVPADSPIRTPQDLRGKRIAVAKGSSGHDLLLAVLRKTGLSLGDVQVRYLAPPDALAAFTSGAVDAWSIWDPYTAQIQDSAHARILLDGESYTNGLSFQVAGDAALADPGRAAAIRDYLGRLAVATAWAQRHPQEWARAWASETGLPVSATSIAVGRRDITYVAIDESVIGAEQQVADHFADAGLIPRPVRMADYLDPRFNDAVTQAVRKG